ncbi:recombination protein RecR [Candidatus Parcubacteria bacterium]|nr:recombination protein RecR [Candidatus Parcubacteria bacterium]
MYPKTIQKVIDFFAQFPGIGAKTAARFAFFLLKKSEKEIKDFAQSILELKTKVKICHFCFKPFEGEEKLCEICKNPARNTSLVCVIEKEQDLETIETAKVYNGLYFILGGPISKIKKQDLQKLRIKELLERVKNPEKFGIFGKIEEIILATNATIEGEALSLFLEKKLKETGKKITKLGRGIPIGGEIEYADEATLSAAFEKRS